MTSWERPSRRSATPGAERGRPSCSGSSTRSAAARRCSRASACRSGARRQVDIWIASASPSRDCATRNAPERARDRRFPRGRKFRGSTVDRCRCPRGPHRGLRRGVRPAATVRAVTVNLGEGLTRAVGRVAYAGKIEDGLKRICHGLERYRRELRHITHDPSPGTPRRHSSRLRDRPVARQRPISACEQVAAPCNDAIPVTGDYAHWGPNCFATTRKEATAPVTSAAQDHDQQAFPPSAEFAATANAGPELQAAADADRLAFWDPAGQRSPGRPLGRRYSTGPRPPSRNGSSAASSTSPTTASTATSRPATATGSRSHWEGEPRRLPLHHLRRTDRRGCKAANTLTELGLVEPATGSRSTCR